jgi:hypothetical protein
VLVVVAADGSPGLLGDAQENERDAKSDECLGGGDPNRDDGRDAMTGSEV